MDFDSVSNKQLNEVERLIGELLLAMKKAKLHDAILTAALRQLELEAKQVRWARFDAANPPYQGY